MEEAGMEEKRALRAIEVVLWSDLLYNYKERVWLK
jgi:hypothetical protein